MPTAVPAPLEITEPFGTAAADPANITLPIPVPSQIGTDPARASFNDGFPPATMLPILAGGAPPYGQDMNGILYMVTGHIAALNGGQLYPFSATYATAVGGYVLGATLAMADGTGTWFNVLANNSNNPDTGGAGWVPGLTYGYTTLTGLTGGTVTPTAAQTRRAVIILQGTLSSNLAVVLPNTLQEWLIVNQTVGAFTVTVKTAAGTGVAVAQGGSVAPVGVYGDGTNIYPLVAPLSVAVDTNPTANTLAERDNLGQIFATRFNQSSALENPSVGAVFVQNTAADGYARKISLANFVVQIKAAVLANPTLTGTTAAPTPASGDRSTKIATTAYVNPAGSLGSNGWRQNADGSIEQWGSITKLANAQNGVVTFPHTFPNACWNVTLTSNGGLSFNSSAWVQVIGSAITTSGFTVGSDDFGTGSPNPTVTVYWRAIGN